MYEIIYDYCGIDGNEERDLSEWFEGDWFDLQSHIRNMKANGCFNIEANYVGE